MFDRVVCVSLDRRADRWDAFLADLPDPWPMPVPERFRAIDGKLAVPRPDYRPKLTILEPYRLAIGGVIPLRESRFAGAWGCWRSHLRILEDALMDEVESLCVFEDDAIFPMDFAGRLADFMRAVPDDWDQVYLGGQHLGIAGRWPEKVSETVLRCPEVNRTHAYVIRGEMIVGAYHHLLDVPAAKVEHELHVDKRFGQMHLTGKWKVYAPRHWMVGQRDGTSDVLGPGARTAVNWYETFQVMGEEPEEVTNAPVTKLQPYRAIS